MVKLGVASELEADLSCENRVPEMVEYCKKVPCSSARPYIDSVPGGSATDTCLAHADTSFKEHAPGVLFPLTSVSVVCFITFLDHLD